MAFDSSRPVEVVFPEYRPRVVVKFRLLPLVSYTVEALMTFVRPLWEGLASLVPGLKLETYFSLPEDVLKTFGGGFTVYFGIQCPGLREAELVAHLVETWLPVERAYVESGPIAYRPKMAAEKLMHVAGRHPQGYLLAATQGVGVPDVVDSGDVQLADIEQGWILGHEDLPPVSGPVLGNNRGIAHGTWVLGVLCGKKNGKAGDGMVPSAKIVLSSEWNSGESQPNTAQAIIRAISDGNLVEGDILLIESQTSRNEPAELQECVFRAILQATSVHKIVVIEAAGNGNREITGLLGNSGAIMVGAATVSGGTEPTYHRLNDDRGSNYGERVDCFAWGEGVMTCGPREDNGYSTTEKYPDFGRTSAASAIAAGVALIAQGWSERVRGHRFGPEELLHRMCRATHGHTTLTGGETNEIGVMPNLKVILV